MAERKKTGGRKAGTPNRLTADVKALAREHGPDAIKRLAHLMKNGDSSSSQVAAAKELLDRAYGKSTQAIDMDLSVEAVLDVQVSSDRERAKAMAALIAKMRGAGNDEGKG